MNEIYFMEKWSNLHEDSEYPHDMGFRVGRTYLYFSWGSGQKCKPLYIGSGGGCMTDKPVSLSGIR